MISSPKVKDFDVDARQRASLGLRPNMALLLDAINDAVHTGDHIGLTVLRCRIEEAMEYVPRGAFRNVLDQLRREVQVSERLAISQQPAVSVNYSPFRWIHLAQEALRKDNAIEKSHQWAI